MYTIHADGELIYDSTLEDYKIGQGEITKEIDKSGSFVFSLYPEHFYYDRFVKMKTVVTVRKSQKIAFRGRALDDGADYVNCKAFTCEGELGFLQDSIIRPYTFTGTPEELFRWYIEQHNAQVGEFKRFKVGTCTVVDPNGYIARENTAYENTLSNMTSRLLEDATGGHFYITHGDDGTDEIPTIHYVSDFTKVATQPIEFGVNLRDFVKKTNAGDIATAIIPLGATVDDGNSDTEDQNLTISDVNDGVDYVYSEKGVALYDWIFKTKEYEDVTDPANLKAKAQEDVEAAVNQSITIELTAVDMHLLDRSIESYNVCEYVPVISPPHNFEDTLLCNKQTMNLLNPASDTVTLGHTLLTFTERTGKLSSSMTNVVKMRSTLNSVTGKVAALNESVTVINQNLSKLADKVVYNGVSGYVLAAFTLEALTFTNGAATVDVSDYIPEGYALLSCLAQGTTLAETVINSVSTEGNTVTVNCRTMSTGAAYAGTTSGAVHFIGICQPAAVAAE